MDLRDAASIISGKSTARDPNSNDLTVRVGVITAIGSGTVSITLGGDTTVIPNVRYLNSYSPNVGDVVQVIVNGTALLILGCTTATGWSGWVPTLTQGATLTKTVLNARYTQVNKTVWGSVAVTITSAGTAANAILIGLPVAALASSGLTIGSFEYVVTATTNYTGIVQLASTGTAFLVVTSSTNNFGVNPAVTAANTHSLSYSFMYEAA